MVEWLYLLGAVTIQRHESSSAAGFFFRRVPRPRPRPRARGRPRAAGPKTRTRTRDLRQYEQKHASQRFTLLLIKRAFLRRILRRGLSTTKSSALTVKLSQCTWLSAAIFARSLWDTDVLVKSVRSTSKKLGELLTRRTTTRNLPAPMFDAFTFV